MNKAIACKNITPCALFPKDDAESNGLVGFWDFGETKHPPCTGVDHNGADWIVDDGDVINGIHCNISRFFIPEYKTVSVGAWNGNVGTGKLEIYAKVSSNLKLCLY